MIYDGHNIPFRKAGSQQPYDYRIPMRGYEDVQPTENEIRNKDFVVGNDFKILLLEIKKTSSNKVMCNDPLHVPFQFVICLTIFSINRGGTAFPH